VCRYLIKLIARDEAGPIDAETRHSIFFSSGVKLETPSPT